MRHLLHLTPGQTILEFGSGDGSFAETLHKVTRGENPIVAARFANTGEALPVARSAIETVHLEAFPGVLAGRTFDCVVAFDMLDAADCARTLNAMHDLLPPGGQLIVFQSNPWNPWLRLRRRLLPRGSDPRRLVSRPLLYEMLSDVGYIRLFAVFTDFVYAPLSRAVIWLMRNLSVVAENMPGVRTFAGTIMLHAQKPPRRQWPPSPSLCDHNALRGALSVVIPCHNEEMNIEPLLDRLIELYGEYLHEIIPVDDNSRDGTAAILARRAAADMRIKPLYRNPPNGVGHAISDGLKAATGSWVLSMDCDFQHLLPEIRDMFDRAVEGADVVVGSRFSRYSVLLNYPLTKIISNRTFHVLAMLVMGRRFRDVTNNLKLMRKEVVAKLELTAPGFAVNAETGLQPMLMGAKLVHSPISWINRSFDMGSSTFRLIKVGGGYASVLWKVFRARYLHVGPYRALTRVGRKVSAEEADGRSIDRLEGL
jgi:SAM-dependent methyltransferase